MKVDGLSLSLDGGNEKNKNFRVNENEKEVTKKREEKLVHSVCSVQKRVGPPEYRRWRRIHGLQLPLHPQQIVGWIILLTVGGASFFVMIPALRPLLRDGLFIVLGTLFCLHILSHLTALLLDPADPELRALKINFSVPEFDRTKHTHVIENGRCHLCNIKTTSSKTKHCSVCNKCIDEFDHHCKWLNHCIGGRNYVPFLICVISAVAASLVVVGISVLELVYYHVDPDSLTLFSSRQHNVTAHELFIPDSVFLGIVTVLGLLAATTAGLLLHLCLFHCYISVLGISTYDYIRNYRQEANDDVHRRLGAKNHCCNTEREVMSNRMETNQHTRNRKFKNCCYYPFSRPPETKEEEEEKGEEQCTRFKNFFMRLRYCLRISRRPKRKMLKRQSTDPEFVDKIIKPFLISLNDGKNTEEIASDSKTPETYFYKVNERVNTEPSQSSEKSKRFRFSHRNFRTWCPKILSERSIQMSENSAKTKCNQIRPSSAATEEPFQHSHADQTDNFEIYAKKFNEKDLVSTIATTEVSPQLHYSLRKLQNSADLKKLGDVLDLIDRRRFEFSPISKSIYGSASRKKRFQISRSRSPPLSPIKESELSNPGSPKIDLVLPSTPVLVRPSTPETSIIFLSNPNSLSSSSEGDGGGDDDDDDDDVVDYREDDENEVVFRPNFLMNSNEDVLQTPHFPRKIYAGYKGQQIHLTKSSKKKKPNNWINMQIKDDL